MKGTLKIIILFTLFFLPAMCPAHAQTKVFTDQTGRTIHVQSDINSVVSLAPSITETVYAMGCGHLLAGVTRYSDYPAEAKKLPVVGSYIKPDIEKIAVLKPDLVIAINDGNPEGLIRRLELFDIPVYVVDPRGLDSVVKTLKDLGELLGATTEAENIACDMNRRIHLVKDSVAKTRTRPAVFYQIGVSPIVSIGKKTFIHEMIETCGGRNIAAGDVPYPRFSREQVIGLNPDIMLISSMAREESFSEVKRKWEMWPSITAVKEKRVHVVDADVLDRPTPRMVDGLEMLVKLIHPELFKDERMEIDGGK